MRGYELMYILEPSLDEDGTQALMGQIDDFMKKQGVTVEKTEPWGKRRLAYRIGKHWEGFYVLSHFQAGTGVVVELERKLRVTDGVMRFITVRIDEEQEKLERLRAKKKIPVEAKPEEPTPPVAKPEKPESPEVKVAEPVTTAEAKADEAKVPVENSPATVEPDAATEPTAGDEKTEAVEPTAATEPTAGDEKTEAVEPTAAAEPTAGDEKAEAVEPTEGDKKEEAGPAGEAS